MLGVLGNWGIGRFQIDVSFVFMDGTGAPKTHFVAIGEESDKVDVPIPSRGYIEGEHAYDACPDGDDCHILVLERTEKRLYEVFGAHRRSDGWHAEGIALWKLDAIYPRTARGQGCTSADAAGLAITPGLIGLRETRMGEIHHAMRLAIPNDKIRSGAANHPNVAFPATHGTRAASAPNGMPYGARLRLKPTLLETDARIKSPGARTLLRALKKYGMILADAGKLPIMRESDRLYRESNPAETGWEGLLEPRDLDFLTPADFEIVGIPKVPRAATPAPATDYDYSRAAYNAALKPPLGCDGIVQP